MSCWRLDVHGKYSLTSASRESHHTTSWRICFKIKINNGQQGWTFLTQEVYTGSKYRYIPSCQKQVSDIKVSETVRNLKISVFLLILLFLVSQLPLYYFYWVLAGKWCINMYLNLFFSYSRTLGHGLSWNTMSDMCIYHYYLTWN